MPRRNKASLRSQKHQQRIDRQQHRQNRQLPKPAETPLGDSTALSMASLMLILLLAKKSNAQQNTTLRFRKGQYNGKHCSPISSFRRDCDQYVGVNSDRQVVAGYTVDTQGRVTEERYRDKEGHWKTRIRAPSFVRMEAFDNCAEKFLKQEVVNWYALRSGGGFQACALDSAEYKRVRGMGDIEGILLTADDCLSMQNNFKVGMKGCHNEADAAVVAAWVYGAAVVGGLLVLGGAGYAIWRCRERVSCPILPSLFGKSDAADSTHRASSMELREVSTGYSNA